MPRKPAKKRYQRCHSWSIRCGACKQAYAYYSTRPQVCFFCESANIEVHLETAGEKLAREMEQAAARGRAFGALAAALLGGLFGGRLMPPPIVPRVSKSALETELLKEGYRKLAAKYHPDKGGDPETMKELNRLKERYGL